MTRICSNCNFENQDDYDFCAKCGTPLIEGVKSRNIVVYSEEPQINKKMMAISYIVTIFLSWSGFIFGYLFKNTTAGVFTFFGFFLPFYLIQAPVKKLRYHGYIQLVISLIGVVLSFYMMTH